MRISPEISTASLVLLGQFNPSIFTPAWFGWNKLLPDKTVDAAELQIATPQITIFRADWLELQIGPERFVIVTAQPPFVRLQDLAVRVFREKLPHTRIGAMGINRQVHFLVNNFGERDQIGRKLAPVEPWGDWSNQLEPDGTQGGMTSLTMSQIKLEDREPTDRLNVKVEPSTRIGEGATGVYVQVNDHYTVADPESQLATATLIGLLENNFDKSIARAEQIIDHVMSLRGE